MQDYYFCKFDYNGLKKNVESGKVTTKEEDMRFFIQRFEDLFEIAEEITTEIVDVIEESWIFQDMVNPYFAYLRSLIELFGKVSGKHQSESYQLADFQEMIVASTIHSLNEVNGPFWSPYRNWKNGNGDLHRLYFCISKHEGDYFCTKQRCNCKMGGYDMHLDRSLT